MEETVCTPVFSDPYGVYLPEDRLQELDLKSGNPVELTFDVDGEEKTILAKVDFRENFNMQKETHALFYGIAQTIHDLPSEGFEKSFGKFKGEKLYEIEIDTYGKLNDYLELVKTQKSRIGEEDLLIGCGFFELFLKGNREIKNLIETPLFKIDKPTFDELLIGEYPPLESIKRFKGKISKPDTILVCTEEYAPTNRQKERIKKIIAGRKYLMPGGDYIFPYSLFTIHGPLYAEGFEGKPDLFQVTEDSVKFTSARDGQVVGEEGKEYEFEFTEVKKILSGFFEDFKMEEKENFLEFKSGTLRVAFLVFSDSIYYSYSHVIEEQTHQAIEDILESLTDALTDITGVQVGKTPTTKNTFPEPLDKSNWVMDTSALYHEVKDNEPTSIMNLFMPNWGMYGKTVTIPWQVLCEINKHKDAESSAKKASEQGVQNLHILKLLEAHGFFDMHVMETPSEIDSSVVPQSGATDLGILSVVEQEEDSVLLTGDRRLIHLSVIKELPVLDIVGISASPSREGFEEEVWSQIEKDIETAPLERNEAIEKISRELKVRGESQKYKEAKEVEKYQEDAENYFDEWERVGRIIEYSKDGKKMIAKAQEFEVVPTFNILTKLTGHVEEIEGKKYLNQEFLEKIRSFTGFSKTTYPTIRFCIPEQYVYEAQDRFEEKPEGKLKALLQLKELENADYQSISAAKAQGIDKSHLKGIAIRAAKKNDCMLLCGENEKELSRLARLLSVYVNYL